MKIKGSGEMKVSSNITAMMTVANMNKANNSAATVMERLSSGLRINSAKDNPAGLAIAHKLSTQVKGLNQASDNIMNGISMIQTAEGAMNEVHSILNRMKELAVQGSNDTLDEEDRKNIHLEMDQLVKEIKNMQENTDFNNTKVLDIKSNIMIQTGAGPNQSLQIEGSKININEVIDVVDKYELKDGETSESSGIFKDGTILDDIDDAIEKTSKIRSRLGAYQNRLEYAATNVEVHEENTIASLSRIEDADMAEEMTNYTQQNVISQAGIAMLAQANQRPQQVLQLLNS